jgi:hypothetical protein
MAHAWVASQGAQVPALQMSPLGQSASLQHVAPFKHAPVQQSPDPWHACPCAVQAPNVHWLFRHVVPLGLPVQSASEQHAPTTQALVAAWLPPVPGTQHTCPLSHCAELPGSRSHGVQAWLVLSQTTAAPITPVLQSLF